MKRAFLTSLFLILTLSGAYAADISHTPVVPGALLSTDKVPLGRPSSGLADGKGVAYTASMEQIGKAVMGQMSSAGILKASGLTGPPGPKGDKGDAGTVGTAGLQGLQGPAGPAGVKGDPGAIGPAGPQGIQGVNGTGPNPRGPWTNSPTGYVLADLVEHNGDSWLAMGYSSGVTPGTDAAKWMLFASKGATGAAGPTGAAGAKGDKGDTGAQGIQGVAGPAGAAGTTGATGATGSTGAAGAQGATGPKGDKGDTGTAGATGPPGDPASNIITSVNLQTGAVVLDAAAVGAEPADATIIKESDLSSSTSSTSTTTAANSAAVKAVKDLADVKLSLDGDGSNLSGVIKPADLGIMANKVPQLDGSAQYPGTFATTIQLGPEIAPTLSSGAWSYGTNWSYNGGTGKADATGATGVQTLALTGWSPTVGARYRVTYTVTNYSAGAMGISLGGITLGSPVSNGSFVQDVQALTTAPFLLGGSSTGFTGSGSGISIKQITGGDIVSNAWFGLQAVPGAPLDVYSDNAPAGMLARFTLSNVNAANSLYLRNYVNNSTAGAGVYSQFARGTLQAPTDVLAGDRIGHTFFGAMAGGVFKVPASIEAYIDPNAGTISGSNAPSYLSFRTAAVGTVTRTEKMRLFGSGGVTFGAPASSIDPGPGNIIISGALSARALEITKTASATLAVTEEANTTINNYGQTLTTSVDLTSAAEVSGLNFIIEVSTQLNATYHFGFKATASRKVYLDGIIGSAGGGVKAVSQAPQSSLACRTFKDGSDSGAYNWQCKTISGTWIAY